LKKPGGISDISLLFSFGSMLSVFVAEFFGEPPSAPSPEERGHSLAECVRRFR
jgi:hypothetical protein